MRGAPETTSVTILVVTPFAEVLRPVKVTLFARGGVNGKDYSASFEGAKASAIPYGRYFAHVTAEGRGIAADVHVGRPDTPIVMSGPDKIIESGPSLSFAVGEFGSR